MRTFLVGLACVVEFLAVLLDLGDVRFIVMGDVRHIEPGAMQERPRNLLDPDHWLDFDGAELREVDFGNFGNTHCRPPARVRMSPWHRHRAKLSRPPW